uniref:Uncharacterized protein n=1 Tax=Tanacetum cinerariifolium TaxID=118510 RepID=A0A699JU46_TANCI|nr:hypothetical protein [Tanacetum cinerariifolium]
MFKVTQKLKKLKKPFHKLLYEKGNLHANVTLLRNELDRIKLALDVDPFNSSLREEEAIFIDAFNEALVLQEKFIKQKAKVDWLRDGDSNTTYFHKAVKRRIIRNRIDVVTNYVGLLFENERVAVTFVSKYEQFLGQAGTTQTFDAADLFLNMLDTQDALYMTRAITHQEIKEALFYMGNDKALGPDGYTAAFFKQAWDIIADDVTRKRGLRQGDPLSSYLFTLVMEVLTLMLYMRVRNAEFTYHRYCSWLNLINLCFADDLFLFAHGDAQSTCVIKEALKEFKHASGLVPSIPKNRRKGKSKVAWEFVCLPRDEGGLGLRRLDCFNKALIVSHLWKLISMKESLWVKWVHTYKLRGRSFWDVSIRGLNLDSRVCDIVQGDGWSWLDYLVSKYPFLDQLVMPNRSTRSDAIE